MKKNLEQLIKTRRSVFPAQYNGGNIPQEDLLKILESARWAPNHRKTEPWRYKVIQGDALKDLGTFMADQFVKNTDKPVSFKVKKLQGNLSISSAVILIFMDRDRLEAVPEWEEIAAVSMSVQNMWLMTHDLGHGCYWSSPKVFADLTEFPLIKVGEREQFLGFFFLGTYDETTNDLPERQPIEKFVQFVG